MDTNIKELLDYLNLEYDGSTLVSPTTLYLTDLSTILSLEAYGIKVITTKGSYSVRTVTAYGLLWRVLNNSERIKAYIHKKAISIINNATNKNYKKLGVLYDDNGYCLELFNPRVTYRIDSRSKTLSEWSPNQWFKIPTKSIAADELFDDIHGCLIMLPLASKKSVVSITLD